ncbi:hypothetical protein [Halorarum salinum]|uniref:Uncharacterized protein n=1 Tax=Halorarum salinum TaxID=2743089 RepID=A0A7D5L933_9EURY|nr:hypothetical protein [Halobaculum salinum]QLG60827.1 hypothetical protein HUG12_03320 [Halobaculum salinum]
MVDTRLLVRIDAFLGLFALCLVLATFYLVVRAPLVGFAALVVLGLGLYGLGSYVSGFLDGAGDVPGLSVGDGASDAAAGGVETDDVGEGRGGEPGAAIGPDADARE